MDRAFFEQLELPDAKYNLDVGSGSGRHEGAEREDACGYLRKTFCKQKAFMKKLFRRKSTLRKS
jgi:hypothetical protein